MSKFHKDSIFGTGPRVPLDREARAQFKAKLKLQRRPGRLTIAAAEVGRVLLDLLGTDGRLDPALATLAALACVSVSTVQRALEQLRACGFVTWTRRLVRCAATGWRAAQASNAYRLLVPACDVHPAQRVPVSIYKRQRRGTGEGWEAQLADAIRQIQALGEPVPAAWAASVIPKTQR